MIWIVIICVIILYFVVRSYLKGLKYGNLVLVSGGVKTGKTELTVKFVYNCYRKNLIKYKIKKMWYKITRNNNKLQKLERPLIYSNVPIGRSDKDVYVKLDYDHLVRKRRFAYGSVVYLCEASLVSGSKDIRDEVINDEQLQFYKLIAHETRGGYCIVDTQSPQDLHYTLKRSLSTYYHIVRRSDYLFKLIGILWVREYMLVDGDHTTDIKNEDPDDAKHDGTKPLYAIVVWNPKWWRRYDRYCYSVLTDDLPHDDEIVKVTKNKKANHLIRFHDYKRKK